MPKLTYALERGGSKRLEIDYRLGWGRATVRLDDHDVGDITSKKALQAGQQFTLPDRSMLRIKLASSFLTSELQVLRNGKPVPGSATDPRQLQFNAYVALFIIAAINIVSGLAVELLQAEFLAEIGAGWFSVGFGVLFLLLGFAVRGGSKLALWAALIVFLLDTGLMVFALIAERNTTAFTGMFVRAALLWALVSGLRGMRQLDADDSPPPDMRSVLKKGLLVLAVGAGLFAIGYVSIQIMSAPPAPTPVLPTVAALPTEPPVSRVIYTSDYPVLMLDVTPKKPSPDINLMQFPPAGPLIPGDLAWNKPTFAEKFYGDGPASATTGGDGWLAPQTHNLWFYVDLGTPQSIHQIVSKPVVGEIFEGAIQNYYIVSDDLASWRVLVDEIITSDSPGYMKPNVFTLESDVTARYVGMYAYNWGGRGGGLQLFAVMPPGYDYTPETLPAS